MNKLLISTFTIALASLYLSSATAQVDPALAYFDPVDWASKNTRDQITIHNGMGTPIMVHIIVHNHGSGSAGIEIRNCGNTYRVKAGAAVICMSMDPLNPVTFSSDSGINMASGTYQIKQL